MALKLRVHWRVSPIQVEFPEGVSFSREVGKIRVSGSPHVTQAGRDTLVEGVFGAKNRVPDVSRYHIDEKRRLVHHDDIRGLELKRKLQQLGQQHVRSIVFLLESPHKDEYKDAGNVYNISRPQVPANGRSGKSINRHLHTVLSRIEEHHLIVPDCHVIISNPIPFQASLHAIHGRPLKNGRNCHWKKFRDYIWRTLWAEQRIRQSFRARLSRYNPSLVINGCTGNLKQLVCQELSHVTRIQSPYALYDVGHPASWNFDENNMVPRHICSH